MVAKAVNESEVYGSEAFTENAFTPKLHYESFNGHRTAPRGCKDTDLCIVRSLHTASLYQACAKIASLTLRPPAFSPRRNIREFDTKFDSPAFYNKSRRLPNS